MFLKISQISPENTSARASFLVKSGLMPATLLKKRLWHWRFPVNFVKFLRTPFYRTPLDDCFCYNSVQNTLGKSKKSSKVGPEQNIFISTFALFFSTSTKHLFLEGRLPIGQICICGMFAEHSYDIFPEYSEKAPHEIPGSIPK